MTEPKSITIRPARNVLGVCACPATNPSRIAMPCWPAWPPDVAVRNSRPAPMCQYAGCVHELGCAVERDEKGIVTEMDSAQLRQPTAPLDCGNSGSTCACLGNCGRSAFPSELIGDASLTPTDETHHGATDPDGRADWAGEGDRAPLRITGQAASIEYRPAVASAQVKTSVLFAGLLAEGKTSVEEPARTAITASLALRAFGAEVERDGTRSASRADRTEAAGSLRSRRYVVSGLLPVRGLAVSGVESGNRWRAVESNALGVAGYFVGDGSRISMVRVRRIMENWSAPSR